MYAVARAYWSNAGIESFIKERQKVIESLLLSPFCRLEASVTSSRDQNGKKMVICGFFKPGSSPGDSWDPLRMHQSGRLDSQSMWYQQTSTNSWSSRVQQTSWDPWSSSYGYSLVAYTPESISFVPKVFESLRAKDPLDWRFIKFEKSTTPNRRGEHDWRVSNESNWHPYKNPHKMVRTCRILLKNLGVSQAPLKDNPSALAPQKASHPNEVDTFLGRRMLV